MTPDDDLLDMRFAPDSSGRETALWRALKVEKSQEAREQLFALYFPFARQIASRHYLDRRSGDIEFAELAQLASVGLLEAIDGFDPGRGAPFRSYASRRIAGSVLDGIGKLSEFREQISFRNRVRSERAKSLAVPDVSALSSDQAMEALVDVAVGLALGFMLEGSGLLVADGEIDPRANAYESVEWRDLLRRVLAEVDKLPDREQLIIRHHYLNGLEFERVSALLGISKGRVSQLHRAAIALLKKRLLNASDFKLRR